MKVSYLSGPALDWAVAICEGRTDVRVDPDDGELVGQSEFDYSTDWAQGGPIIEREKITVGPYWREESDYCAYWEYPYDDDPPTALGNTPLIAAMRCYVASKLGEEIEIPPELT